VILCHLFHLLLVQSLNLLVDLDHGDYQYYCDDQDTAGDWSLHKDQIIVVIGHHTGYEVKGDVRGSRSEQTGRMGRFA